MYELIEKTEIFNVHKMVIKAPEIANSIQAGQFVIIMGDEFSERIPLTISDWNTEAGTI